MPTTTSLGALSSFLAAQNGSGCTPDELIRVFVDGGDADWRTWVDESGAFEDMVRALTEIADARLPDGAWLAGDQIHILAGQSRGEADALFEAVRSALEDIEDAVLETIVEEHAPADAHLAK
ncbi:hypothetical protein [Streptomyces violascens]|uniref:hypothetical protein n=1 Tax=Streptomyces violascens TaxID=67381 RepID=UPI00167BEBC9|nr:hypothetical protein [Streptomyces violascens]GGU40716.1 hypothetical protein GCM10010289_72130 [Streptomyces violascens]